MNTAMEKQRIEYKARATRLRAAIKLMFGIDCTSSEAYELVAKEENFPNWDAASACLMARTSMPALKESNKSIFVSIKYNRFNNEKNHDLDSLFTSESESLKQIREKFYVNNNRGELFLCSGMVGSGKSETIKKFMNEMSRRFDTNGLKSSLNGDATTAHIGEIRDVDSATQAISLVLEGTKVFASIHASHGSLALDRVRGLLNDKQFHGRLMSEILNELESNGQCTVIHHGRSRPDSNT